jgi:hypothetical protein
VGLRPEHDLNYADRLKNEPDAVGYVGTQVRPKLLVATLTFPADLTSSVLQMLIAEEVGGDQGATLVPPGSPGEQLPAYGEL